MLVAVVDGGDGDTLDLLRGEREGTVSGPCEKRDDAYRHSPGFGFVISPLVFKNESIALNFPPQFSVVILEKHSMLALKPTSVSQLHSCLSSPCPAPIGAIQGPGSDDSSPQGVWITMTQVLTDHADRVPARTSGQIYLSATWYHQPPCVLCVISAIP